MMGRILYRCVLCGGMLPDLDLLLRHFEEKHADLPEVQNWKAFRLNGYRYGSWRKYRDIRSYVEVRKG